MIRHVFEQRNHREECTFRHYRISVYSAQAAQARLERARTSPILPGRSESVVRGSSIDYSPGIFLAIDDVVGPSAVRSFASNASNAEGPAPRSVRNLQLGLRYSR